MSAAGDVTKIDISSTTIFRVILIAIGFWFLYLIIDMLVMLFAAVVVASAIRPVADVLQRYRVPRAASALLVYAIVLLLFSSIVTLMIPPLTEQTVQLAHALPQLLERLKAGSALAIAGGEDDILASLQRLLAGAGDNLANVGANIFYRTRSLFSGAFTVLFVFVIAIYLVVDRDALKRPWRLVLPAEHLAYAERLIDRMQRNIGRWVVAQLSLAVIVGVAVWLGLWLLGVNYSLVLGLLAGAFEVVPVIGPVAAAIPAVLIGFSQSLLLGLGVLLFYVLVQQAENNLLIPAVMRKATGLNPLITILAVLLGARLGGIVGVILAVPAAVVLSTFLLDIVGRASDQELAG